MSRCRGTPPPALPPWLLLLVLTASAARATGDDAPADAAADAAAAPAAAVSVASGAPAILQDPLGASDEDAALEAFLRDSRAGRDNFLRFGRAACENLMRSVRADRDNFLRFGRANRDNFLRFGRADCDRFLRVTKAARDNFLRFGRAGRDNFLRFGKSHRDNFLRFGRAGRDNFLRFGRGDETDLPREVRDRSQNNFLRLGRGGDNPDTNDVSLEEDPLAANMARGDSEDEHVPALAGGFPSDAELERYLRLTRDRNFLRFGRGRPDNFLRLGRVPSAEDGGADEQPEEDEEDAAATEAATEGSPVTEGGDAAAVEDRMQRVGRALRPRNIFGRWKMSDLNFIRLGRSVPSDETEMLPVPAKRSSPQRAGRSRTNRQDNHVDNFIRLGNGKRADDNLVRSKRGADAASYPDAPALRTKRALRPGDSPLGGGGGASADCSPQRPIASSIFGDLPLAPLSYYSPLAMGLPNYLFARELLMPPPREGAAVEKRSDGRSQRNFIRLG